MTPPTSPAGDRASELTIKHLVVVGGGIAGLVTALDCARVGIRVTVLEASGQLGGTVAAKTIAGVDVDTGAESYATRGGHVRRFIDTLTFEGSPLADRVVTPAAPGAWVHLPEGRTVPLPKAGILGIPSVPLAKDVVRVIGWRGALRAYLDRLRPVLTIGHDHNLGELVQKRMGSAVLDKLVAPVTRGVYSADPGELDVARAAPGLSRALTNAGSLSGAVAALRADAPAGAAVEGLVGGVHTLVRAMEAELTHLGAEIRRNSPVTALHPDYSTESGEIETWRVDLAHSDATSDPESIEADFVVVATPEASALAVLGPLSAELGEQHPIDPPQVELITLVIDSAELDRHPRGTGVLVAAAPARQAAAASSAAAVSSAAAGTPDSRSVAAKALTHSTAKWEWLAERVRATGHPHRHIVRLSYGSQAAAPLTRALDDGAATHLALRDAALLFGVPPENLRLVGSLRSDWSGTLAGAARGQRERADEVRTAVSALGGIEATGGWLAGTGIASVIPDALATAGRIRSAVLDRYRSEGRAPQLPGASHSGDGMNQP